MLAKLARELPDGDELVVRAEVGRLPLHRVPRRRRRRAREPQRASRSPRYFPELRRAAAGAAARTQCVRRRRARDRDRPTASTSTRSAAAHPPGREPRRRSSPPRSRRRSSRSTCSPRATTTCATCRSRERRGRARGDARGRRSRRSTSRPRRATATPRPTGSTRFEGAGFDGVVAKPLDGAYEPGERTMLKVKHQRTADCVVAGFRVHKDGNGVGSLLLGLYDDDGVLHHVGVASGMAAPLRKRAARRASSRCARTRSTATRGASGPTRAHERTASACPAGRAAGTPSKDLSWEPLRIELVAEVAYERLHERPLPPHRAASSAGAPTATRRLHLRAARDVAPAELRELFGV